MNVDPVEPAEQVDYPGTLGEVAVSRAPAFASRSEGPYRAFHASVGFPAAPIEGERPEATSNS